MIMCLSFDLKGSVSVNRKHTASHEQHGLFFRSAGGVGVRVHVRACVRAFIDALRATHSAVDTGRNVMRSVVFVCLGRARSGGEQKGKCSGRDASHRAVPYLPLPEHLNDVCQPSRWETNIADAHLKWWVFRSCHSGELVCFFVVVVDLSALVRFLGLQEAFEGSNFSITHTHTHTHTHHTHITQALGLCLNSNTGGWWG